MKENGKWGESSSYLYQRKKTKINKIVKSGRTDIPLVRVMSFGDEL